MKSTLNLSGTFAIVTLVLMASMLFIENETASRVVDIATSLSTLVVLYGFFVLAKKEQLHGLKVAVISLAFLEAAGLVYFQLTPSITGGFLMGDSFMYAAAGVLSIVFGRALLSLVKKFGNFVAWVSASEIALGISFLLSGIGMFMVTVTKETSPVFDLGVGLMGMLMIGLAVLLIILTLVLEAVLLFSAAEKYK